MKSSCLCRLTITVGLVLFVLLTGARSAVAQHEQHHYANIAGVKGMEINHIEDGHAELGSGISPFYERSLFDHWVELELAVILLQLHGEIEVPIDLIAKIPFGLSQTVTAFVGAGATLAFEEGEEDWSTHYGFALSSGVYVWLAKRWGMDLEVDYKHLMGTGNSHEVEVAVGPAYRF